METQQDEWAITIGFEFENVTIAMIDNDNEQHNGTRCYPVDADSIRCYS